MSRPLFVFGSLRDLEVLQVVLGRPATDIRSEPAWLHGYRAVRVPDETYPVLIPAPGNAVGGELLRGLTAEDFGRIAFFENQEYRFEHCIVTLQDGGRLGAVYCGENVTWSEPCEPWSLEFWQQFDKAVFMQHTRRFMALYGNVGSEEADEIWRQLKKGSGGIG